MSLKVEREGRRILGVNLAEVVTFGIKPLIGRGELGEGRVDAIFGHLWRAGENDNFMVSAIDDE